jgi:hypothetical protein
LPLGCLSDWSDICMNFPRTFFGTKLLPVLSLLVSIRRRAFDLRLLMLGMS